MLGITLLVLAFGLEPPPIDRACYPPAVTPVRAKPVSYADLYSRVSGMANGEVLIVAVGVDPLPGQVAAVIPGEFGVYRCWCVTTCHGDYCTRKQYMERLADPKPMPGKK